MNRARESSSDSLEPAAGATFIMHAPAGQFSDFRRNLSVVFHARVSWAWALVVIGIQFAVEISGGAVSVIWWFENFGLSRDGILAGKIWQLFSHGVLHGFWWHASLNALFVLLVGSRIEHVAGPTVMVKCTVLGILAGGVSHLVLGTGLLVGLSGGCFALLLLLRRPLLLSGL